MGKDSFVLYAGYIEHIEDLTAEEQGQLFMAILRYANGMEVGELKGAVKMAFSFIRAQMDRDAEKYEEKREKRSAAGKQGGRPKKEAEEQPEEEANAFFEKQTKAKKANAFSEKQKKLNDTVTVTVTDTVTVNDIKETPKPPKGGKRFTPPSLEEIAAYCEERGNGIDPEAFYNFYASKNWNVGKTKMADWKAAVRTWEIRRREERTGNVTPFKRKDEGRYGPNGVRIDNIDENDGLGEILR